MAGFYKHLGEIWKKPQENLGEVWKQRLMQFRRENAVTRVESPLRLDKARALGYKAKKGIIVLRVRVKKGGHRRAKPKGGRKPRNLTTRKTLDLNYQNICERRAQEKYRNLEVLNSYWVAQDGQYYWYEVIMVDPETPEIKSDKDLNWISKGSNRHRVFRGLTSSGKKSRGMRYKGERRPILKKRIKAKYRKAKKKSFKLKSKKGTKGLYMLKNKK